MRAEAKGGPLRLHPPPFGQPMFASLRTPDLTATYYTVTVSHSCRPTDKEGSKEMASGSDLRGKSLLTNREREVFELLVQDKTTKEIAKQLFVSEKTVRNHISNVMCSVV